MLQRHFLLFKMTNLKILRHLVACAVLLVALGGAPAHAELPDPVAQAVGQPVFDFIKETNPELAACDTETCRWQLRTSTGANVVHPIWLLHKAYGLS